MKLSLEEKTKLITFSERASDLLVKIIDKNLPKMRKPTKQDKEFKQILSKIYQICPLLSDSYVLMYNYIQKQKISLGDSYFKRIRRASIN